MIEGLKIEVTSEELSQHFKERAESHKQKADGYAGQVDELQKLRDGSSTGFSNDPVYSLG